MGGGVGVSCLCVVIRLALAEDVDGLDLRATFC